MKSLNFPEDFHVFLSMSEDGVFYWRTVPVEFFARPADAKGWNGRFSGKPAGTVATTPYGRKIKIVRIKGRGYAQHIVSFMMFVGEIPKGKIVDFLDGDGLNVSPSNLFLTTELEKSTRKSEISSKSFISSEKHLHLITREIAKSLGMTRYFSCRPCPKGHRGERTVHGWGCCACAADLNKSEVTKTRMRNYYLENRKKIDAYQKKWKGLNRPRKAQGDKDWKQNNKEAVYASNRRRQIAKINRTVSWGKELTDFVFAEANHLAKLRSVIFGLKWQVDHILPLMGSEVSGLHIWNNFQVIPAEVNAAKKDRLIYLEPFSWIRYYS